MSTPMKVTVFLLLSYFMVVEGEERCSNAVSHATISFEALKPYIQALNSGKLASGNYSVLSIDRKYDNLLVGARDNAFLVDLDNLSNFWNWSLPQTQSSRPDCNSRQDFENVMCHSFIKVMLLFKDRIFLCWTGEAPACTWRNRTNLSDSPGTDKRGNVFTSDVRYSVTSISPHHNSTALITETGRLFMGSSGDSGSSISSRSFKKPELKVVKSSMKKSSFYDNVHFVRCFDIGHYVYFFFRERTLECSSCGKMEISRVARICKGDYGGIFSLKKTFVTIQKAKISCSDGKEYPVNFNEIQDVSWDQESNLFYAAFTTHVNGPASSAICIYTLSDINRVFDESQFLNYDSDKKTSSTVENKQNEYFQNCTVNKKILNPKSRHKVPKGMMATTQLTFKALMDLGHDPLMDDTVQPSSSKAWLIKSGLRMTGVVVDKVEGKTVVYASTDRGSVLKMFQPEKVDDPCILFEMYIFPTGKKEVIKKLVIDTKRHVLYLGSNGALSKLSLEQCGSHGHHSSSCLYAHDPYCGWDKQTRKCASVLSHSEPSRLKQDLNSCPEVKVAEVGWSQWRTCGQEDGNLCRCQVRPCQKSSCEGGHEYRLTNCTVDMSVGWEGVDAWRESGVVHGNWSAWGDWGECSVMSWAGVRQRTRTCSNPVPRRGGRPCTGDSVEYEPCRLKLEVKSTHRLSKPWRVLNPELKEAVLLKATCTAEGYRLTDVRVHISVNKTIDCDKEKKLCEEEEWGNWSPWGKCSSLNVTLRRRLCARKPCIGESVQERACTGGPCNGKHSQEKPCTPTKIGNCADVVDDSWGPWSSCVCDHDLNLIENRGVRYRIPKCRNLCPDKQSCPDKVQFDSITCGCISEGSNSAVQFKSGQRNSPSPANYKLGHVIGAAIVGCVVAIVMCVGAMFLLNRRKKLLEVSKTEETSHETSGSGAKYSTTTRENGTELSVPPSPSNGSTESKDRNTNTKVKSPSPIKNLFKRQDYDVTSDAV